MPTFETIKQIGANTTPLYRNEDGEIFAPSLSKGAIGVITNEDESITTIFLYGVGMDLVAANWAAKGAGVGFSDYAFNEFGLSA